MVNICCSQLCHGRQQDIFMQWKTNAPYKVASFTWFVAQNACLTQENLQSKDFQLCLKCCLCGYNSEGVNHLNIVALRFNFRTGFSIWWDLKQMMPRQTVSYWSAGPSEEGIPSKRHGANYSDVYMVDSLRERNARSFEDRGEPIEKIKMNCLLSFYFWCKQNYVKDAASAKKTLSNHFKNRKVCTFGNSQANMHQSTNPLQLSIMH